MTTQNDGHSCLKSNLLKAKTSGDFKVCLSYNELSDTEAEFVLHVWSNSFDLSSDLQRLQVLDGLNFQHFKSCPHTKGACFYATMGCVMRNPDNVVNGTNETYYNRFEAFADNIQEIFQKMHDLEKLLRKAGLTSNYGDFELREASLSPSGKEKLYLEGDSYDVYKDIKTIVSKAKNEVFIVDAFPDETLFDLYLDSIPVSVEIKFLTKNPQGKFVAVAKLFANKQGRKIDIRENQRIHDRYVFADDECWVIGPSLRGAGNKTSYVVKMEGKDENYAAYSALFNAGKNII